jgi:hypothetical protein
MNAASTRLALHTLLPSDKPARRNHNVSKIRAATPDRKKIGTNLLGIELPTECKAGMAGILPDWA